MPAPVLTADHHPDCYPSGEAKALAFFREAMDRAPQDPVPPPPSGSNLVGIITPHIDFRVSLRAYAAAFRPLVQEPLAETYVIIGVGHKSRLEWNLDDRDYITPLGRAVCARNLVDQLSEGLDRTRMRSPEAHVGEHSIEFPLLWLQALHRLQPGREKDFRFLPILCGGMHAYVEGLVEWKQMEDFHRLSRALGALIREGVAGKVRVIVSIDGCHLGPRFQHPFEVTPALLQATAGWEQMLWACAARGEARAFLDWMREEGNDRYFDGVGALALLLEAGGGKLALQRTYYEQWFTARDASAVTFSSGRVLAA